MARGFRSHLCLLLVASLLANAFCAPAPAGRPTRDRYRPYRGDVDEDNMNDFNEGQPQSGSQSSTSSTASPDDDDDDDDFGDMQVAPSNGGGSNIVSILNLVTALFPGSGSTNRVIRNVIRQYLLRYQKPVTVRRQDIADNVIDIDYVKGLTPPFQRQEEEDNDESDESSSDDDDHEDDHDDDNDDDHEDAQDDDHSSESKEDNAAEESIENRTEEDKDKASQQDSNGDNSGDDDNDSDYSEEPDGDGQGGGILGLLAGLSGGEDGSDLGTLLATVSQIVGNLSGDGFDLNAVLASAFGLFVGLLSEGEDNPGTVIASYLLTSLDTITGGGAKNNGAYFGSFLSTLVKGISAGEGASDESSEEDGNGKMKMSDSTGFFVSLLMSLSGDMSQGSSGGSSHPW